MQWSHRPAGFAVLCMLAGSAWSQTPNPADPPAAPSLSSGPSHPAHPVDSDAAVTDSGMHQENPRPTGGTDPDPAATRAATDFVMKATIDNLTEMELGRLALTRSPSVGVRQFAQQMIADYDQANTKLGAVAAMKNISVPKEIDAAHQSVVQSLAAKQGRAFEAAYVDQMLAAHRRAIVLYTAAAGQTDSEIAAFAYKALPTLKTHRQMAQSLKGSAKTAA